MSTILVQISEATWTMQALHLACALALNTHSRLVLLYMIPVSNPGVLGTTLARTIYDEQDKQGLETYSHIAAEYGVDISLMPMQFISSRDALLQAVEETGATALFTRIEHSSIPFWEPIQIWMLGHQLAARECRLCLIEKADHDAEDWVPFVMSHATKQGVFLRSASQS